MIVLLAGCLIALGGCSQPPAKEMPVIRYVNFKVYDPVYVAIDKGFCEKQGIKCKIIGDVLGGPTAIQAVASGSCEAGLSSIPALINANAAGLPVQGVVDVQTTLPGQALQRWFVLEDSPIQVLEDVPGHVYAVNLWRSSFHYTSLLAMSQRGIDEDSVTWTLLSFSNQIPALMEGEIDVAGFIQPYQNYLLMEYGDQVRELFNDYDDVYGTRHVSLIFVNRVWAQSNPETAEAFVTAIADAIDWIEDNQEEARGIIAKYTGIPTEAVPEYHFTEHGRVRVQDVAAWMHYLRGRGDLTADWLEPGAVATDEYNARIR